MQKIFIRLQGSPGVGSYGPPYDPPEIAASGVLMDENGVVADHLEGMHGNVGGGCEIEFTDTESSIKEKIELYIMTSLSPIYYTLFDDPEFVWIA